MNGGAASHPSIEVFHVTLCGLYTRAVRHIGCDTTTSYKGKCVSDWRVVPGGHQLSLGEISCKECSRLLADYTRLYQQTGTVC